MASLNCLYTTESLLFVKLIASFCLLLLVFSFAFDYTDPFKQYDLEQLLQHFINQDEREHIKYCLDSKSYSDKEKSVDSIRTIDSVAELDSGTWKRCANIDQL